VVESFDMDAFWVQENFTRSVLVLHLVGCPRANEGHVSNVIHGAKWHGPFYERDDALALAARVKQQAPMTGPHTCPICRP
jgi:hypothetical protein